MITRGYSKLNYHRLLMAIGGYFINGYWWKIYKWLLIPILLMAISGYSKLNYDRLLIGYFKLNYHKLVMAIVGHSINGYWWLFY